MADEAGGGVSLLEAGGEHAFCGGTEQNGCDDCNGFCDF